MKKKAYQGQLEEEYSKISVENNNLKLENAALRAENQLLKRYLCYFENLFAKKTTGESNSMYYRNQKNKANDSTTSSQQKFGAITTDEDS